MGSLLPYQLKGASFLAQNSHALLADEMGLGKTIQAIRGLDTVGARDILVITPSIARLNWLFEMKTWTQVERQMKILYKLADVPERGVNICSFDYATANYKTLSRQYWDALIIDESHFIKNPTSKRAKAIMGKLGVIHAAKRVWLLTGTPAPNNPSELWIPLFAFGLISKTYDQFIDYFCVTKDTTYGKKIIGAKPDKIPELRSLLAKFMLRRKKSEVMVELPPLNYRHIFVEPGLVDIENTYDFAEWLFPKDRREELHAEIERQEKLIKVIDANALRAGDDDFLAMASGLRQSVPLARRYLALQKIDPTVDFVKNFVRNYPKKKLVIFAIHRDVVDLLRRKLERYNPITLYGKTPDQKRNRNIKRFQTTEKYKIIICNIQAAGTAITLTAAHNVLFVEQDWVPGNNAQAVMRCHRYGQKHKVNVIFFLLDHPFEARLGLILKRKTSDLTKMFD